MNYAPHVPRAFDWARPATEVADDLMDLWSYINSDSTVYEAEEWIESQMVNLR